MPKINTSTFPSDPIGILLNGKLNVVKAEDPPFRPLVIDDEGMKLKANSEQLLPNQLFDAHDVQGTPASRAEVCLLGDCGATRGPLVAWLNSVIRAPSKSSPNEYTGAG